MLKGQKEGQDGRGSKGEPDKNDISQEGHEGPDEGEARGPQHDDEFSV